MIVAHTHVERHFDSEYPRSIRHQQDALGVGSFLAINPARVHNFRCEPTLAWSGSLKHAEKMMEERKKGAVRRSRALVDDDRPCTVVVCYVTKDPDIASAATIPIHEDVHNMLSAAPIQLNM
jgi:hypothetical protein